ncbi:GntR family transcriptional regulator [Streptacidiphilus sp. PB12-B1b]|uniref:GntR family transcriptional regulator n=1 Tax=Streptacidiphilus sp. PB12-B1b TaxID=2705012 RepID=UPI0015F9C93F|nr:GntR family transcriptional regulator [Streptacidiphilus sp. PB12-B1b]QMU76340.1 GntR family transcriptional regulator [Streptacidiphilus sp. PB12-B1b]
MALPKYEQIAQSLRGSIVRGELVPGDTIPSVPELSRTWEVAKATAERAIAVLRQEGLVDSRQGVGTVVRERVLLAYTAGERYQTARATGNIYTSGEHAEILGAERAEASEEVAAALGVEPGTAVVWRQRVTLEGQLPTGTSISWFLADLATQCPRLLMRDRIREGTTRYLEVQTGRRPSSGRDTWTARLATPEELTLLQLEAPAAVSETRHTVFDADGNPLGYEVGVIPAGRWARVEEYAL